MNGRQHYFNSEFNNIPDGKFYVDRGNGYWDPPYAIKSGLYRNPSQLVVAINKQLNAYLGEKISLSYNEIDQHIAVILSEKTRIKFDQELAWTLGFHSSLPIDTDMSDDTQGKKHSIGNHTEKEIVQIVAHRAVDLAANRHNILVYSNIIQHQIVGHESAPLLRVCNVANLDEKSYSAEFIRPYYLMLKSNRIDIVEIYMRKDSGGKPCFKRAKVTCVLHFRRKKLI